jgi:hypothetical protein
MFCAQSEEVLKSEGPADWMGAEGDRFHANLSSCLHAMGQPLTVLRCTVAAAAVQGIPAEKQQKYLGTSAEQVQLLCGLFDCLRELLDSSQLGGERSPVAVSQLLSFAVEDQMPLFQASDLAIDVSIPAELDSTVLADMNRSLKALTFVLKIAASVSSPGDVIELKVAPKNGGVGLIVENERARCRSFTSLQRLTLAVAEANVRSQDGDYACAQDPFRATLTLPVHNRVYNRVLDLAQLKGNTARYEAQAGCLCS